MKLTVGAYRILAAYLYLASAFGFARADERARAILLHAEAVTRRIRTIQADIEDSNPSSFDKARFRAMRSGSFSLVSGTAEGTRTVFASDGTRVLNCEEAKKTCTTLDTSSLFEFGNVDPALFLVTSFLEPGLLPQMESPTYAGVVHRNGQTLQAVRCAATSDQGQWTLYFAPEGFLTGVDTQAFQAKSARAPAEQVRLTSVRLNPLLQQSDFRYSPPAGVETMKSDNPVDELPPVLSRAPFFSMPTTDGRRVTLASAMKGKKALLLNITFAECGACILEVPPLKRLYSDLKDKGLAILAVNIVDTRESAQKLIDRYALPYPVGLDSKAGGETDDMARRYRADAGGLNILIGADGKLVWKEAGLNEKYLRCVLERMGIASVRR